MSRLAGCFERLKQAQRKALIPFVTAGDPSLDITLKLMHGLVEAGADIIELGVPFSDPMADGPVIQRASERALINHVSLRDVLALVSRFRTTNADTPIVLMGYLNPIEVLGYAAFAEAAAKAGADGVITVDIPPEEATDLVAALRQHNLDPIFLTAPTSGDERLELVSKVASGFIYYVSLKGVTGAANLDLAQVEQKLGQIRQHTDLPLGVGFGIKDAETAARMAAIADAVVVGSALVSRIEANLGQEEKMYEEATGLIRSMRQAIDQQ